MIEFNQENSAAATAASGFAVSVIGIGGAGMNVIDKIALEGMPGADLIGMNCDVRALTSSMAGRKVQLGRNLTQGLGCGGDPELGQEAAESSDQEIRELLAGRSMVFICAGLGGGTGGGAAPEVARIARETGAFVVVFATLPFSFEGKRRMKQGLHALQNLRRHANALVTFENDRMGELIVPKKGVQEAFDLADKIIGQSVRAVTSVVTQPGLIHIGMDDLIAALRNTDSRCLFGFGQAKGDNRASEALALAMKSPLLDRGQMLSSARNVLVHICGGNTLTLFEIESLMNELSRHVSEDAQILFGAAVDEKLNEHVTVTLITSLNHAPPGAPVLETPGSRDPAPQPEPAPVAPSPAPEPAPVAPEPAPQPVSAAAPPPRVEAVHSPEPAPVPETPPPAAAEPVVSFVQPVAEAFVETAPVSPPPPAEVYPVDAVTAAVAGEAEQPWSASRMESPEPETILYAEAEEGEISAAPAPAFVSNNGHHQENGAPDWSARVNGTEAEEEEETPAPAAPPERIIRVDRAAAAAVARPARHFAVQPETPAPRKRFTLSEFTRQVNLEDGEAERPAQAEPAPAAYAPQQAASRTSPLPHSPPSAEHSRLAPIRPIAATSPPRLASRQPNSPPVLGHAHLSRPPADASSARVQQHAAEPRQESAPVRARYETTEPVAAPAEPEEDLDVPTFLRKKR